MINVFLKSKQEISREYALKKLKGGNAPIKKVCETYIVENGERIDCCDLSESKLLDLIEEDYDSLICSKVYNNKIKNSYFNASINEFIRSIDDDYKASYEGILRLINMSKKYDIDCNHIHYIMANLKDIVSKLEDARKIIKYQKQLKKDNSKITNKELYETLLNLAKLEKNPAFDDKEMEESLF